MPSHAPSLGHAPAEARFANRYEILEPLARGGMGSVFRAVECSTGEPRAIKRMRVPNDDRANVFLAAFEREYQALASLEHPRIIRVYEYGVDSEGPYYVMELVEGPDLKQAAPIPWRKACVYLRELASTLSLLHARRMLHRDLSPTNVKLTPDGHCKLLDFGALAAFGRARWIVGTPPMIAPEVLSGGMRAERAAAMIEPFSVLPRWMGPVGIYELCLATQHIGREHQAQAYDSLDRLTVRFANPRWYPELPQDTRIMCLTGCHFGRGVFASFRDDGRAALESADFLDASGLKLYAMVASQLRQLYHLNRGELAIAQRHREAVELHAAQVGTAFQVDLWEPAALLPLHIALGDLVELKRTAHRIDQLAEMAPGLELYARLAQAAVAIIRRDPIEGSTAQIVRRDILERKPRSYIGWSTAVGALARAYNQQERHAEARDICEIALATLRDADREYVSLFLEVELQAAHADAGLGREQAAFERLDYLLARFDRGEASHPLTLVLLHEARARIAAQLERREEYERSASEAERWARQTGTPALIAKCERLAELQRTEVTPRAKRPSVLDAPAANTTTLTVKTLATRKRR